MHHIYMYISITLIDYCTVSYNIKYCNIIFPSLCLFHQCIIVVRRICGKYKMDCGFGGKSTKIGIVDVKEVLSDFRYSAKLNFTPLVSIK